MKKLPKIFFFLLLAVLFLSFGLFYNQERKTLAQGEILLDCGEEIPIGEAIDEAVDLVTAIDAQLQMIYTAPGAQIGAAKTLFDLPDECKAENCNTDCNITSSDVEEWGCPPLGPCPSDTVDEYRLWMNFQAGCPSPGIPCNLVLTPPAVGPCPMPGPFCSWHWQEEVCDEPCTTTVTQCDIGACSGIPCPFGEITNQLNQIENSYSQTKAAREAIDGLIGHEALGILIGGKRGDILDKLEDARGELEGCAVSADAMIEGEVIGEMLWTCDEVKYQRLLDEGETCQPNNFFCCKGE